MMPSVIFALQCLLLAALAVLPAMLFVVMIKDIDNTLPTVIPRWLRLPFWLAAALFFCFYGADVFPPVMDFILSSLDKLTVFMTKRFEIEPFTACLASLCCGFLIGLFGSAASSMKALVIMAERHRKGMFEELDELIARCPCRHAEKDSPA